MLLHSRRRELATRRVRYGPSSISDAGCPDPRRARRRPAEADGAGRSPSPRSYPKQVPDRPGAGVRKAAQVHQARPRAGSPASPMATVVEEGARPVARLERAPNAYRSGSLLLGGIDSLV